MERGKHSNKLPPEPWMSLGEHQLPPGLGSHSGSSVGCSTRDSSGQAPFYSHGVSEPPALYRDNVHVPRTSMIQPFGLLSQAAHSSRPVASNSGSQAGTDRSAWTHLLSLDPSLANYNSQNSNQHQPSSYGRPPFEMGNLDRPVSDHNSIGHHLDLVSETLSLPSMSTPLSHHATPYNTTLSIDNFHQRSVPPPPSHHTAPEHLNELINLSHNAGNFSRIPPTSATNQPVESLEQGGYSPVSPPTHDTAGTPPTSLTSRHVADILKKDVPSSTAFSLSSENSFSLVQNKRAEPFMKIPTSLQSITTELSGSLHNPQSLSSPLDMPLDMTKVFPSKEEAQNLSVFRKNNHLMTSASGNAAVETSKLGSESKTDYLSGENAKELIDPVHKPSVDTISNLQLSTERQLKPVVRSTPKKSNFYGRDASLFSFSTESLSGPHSSYIPSSPKQPPSDVLLNSASNVLSNSSIACAQLGDSDSGKPFIVEAPQGSLSLFEDATAAQVNIASDCDSSASNFADSFIDASTRDCEPCNTVPEDLNPYSLQSQDSATVSTKTGEEKTPEILEAPQSSINLTNMDNMMAQQEQRLSTVVDGSCNDKGLAPVVIMPNTATVSDKDIIQSSQCDVTNLGIESAESAKPDDVLPALTPVLPVVKTTAKRRKRKGSGFQTRQRKRAKKVQGLVISLRRTDEVNADIVPIVAAQGSTEADPMKAPSITKRRATRAIDDPEGDDPNAAPRRSSSRKSKANAMRLIELQADSSYGYTSHVVEESPPPPPVKTKKRATRAKKTAIVQAKNEDGKLSGDSLSSNEATEDEQDMEYAPDEEEEFQEDLSPVEEGKVKFGKSRKVGGLKISIKLGNENLAQIVSGIRGRPPSKKRKSPLKKMKKSKVKSQAIVHEDEDDEGANKEKDALGQDTVDQSQSSTGTAPLSQEIEEKSVSDDREKSLLDKYFDAAIAVNKQINTVKSKKKVVQLKKKTSGKSAPSKLAKTKVKGDGQKSQKSAAGKSAAKLESDTEMNDKAAESNNGSNADEVPKFVCGYCPKRYHNKDELMAHMEAHMAEMESKGDNDNNTKEEKKPSLGPGSKKIKLLGFQEKPETKAMPPLNKAEKKGVPLPEHKCGECGLVFSSKASLLDHVSTHTVDKPFECNLCHKCFKERDLLSAHRKTHNQEGLVRCPICSKGFIHEPDLVRHIQTHPKRSTPLVPLKRKISPPPQKTIIKTLKTSTPPQDSEQLHAKPTSFASALSGSEVGPSNKTLKNPTIRLRRSEVSAALISLDASKVSKTSATPSQPQKPPKQPETGDLKTHSIVAKQAGKESVVRKPDDKGDKKPSTTADSEPGHCTCKECPECVTRFLQSFY